ncbi:hypothetical protein TUM15765_19690 [Neisseria gonorrhoeae]|nr:hypothetical protein TUM15765_19690 [Neisseria gonorrhoeae]SCW10806.1 hypothetical protein ESCNG_170016 [Neisseria gonorrhoeae]
MGVGERAAAAAEGRGRGQYGECALCADGFVYALSGGVVHHRAGRAVQASDGIGQGGKGRGCGQGGRIGRIFQRVRREAADVFGSRSLGGCSANGGFFAFIVD